MTQKPYIVLISILAGLTTFAHSQNGKFPNLTGPYLGQKPPGKTPEIFAPGIISTEMHEHSMLSFSPDGSEVLWSSQFLDNFGFPGKVLSTNNKNGSWSESDFFSGIQLENSNSAFYSPDGQRIYFTSQWEGNEIEKSVGGRDIWFIEKKENGWTLAKNLGAPVNSQTLETSVSLTSDKTIYFQGEIDPETNFYGIYRSRLVDGIYQKPELLPANINTQYLDWTPFIAPDESYLLFSSHRPGGLGDGDIYVGYRSNDDTWTDPINLGPTINGSATQDRFPYVSPDGKYLFFASNKLNSKLESEEKLSLKNYKEMMTKPGNSWNDFYWVNASIIEELRPNN